MGCGGIQPRETDCVGRAWCGRGLRDRHPATTRPTARSLPLGARATGKTRRSVNAVSIAQSENVFGAPGRPDGDGRHASVASAESHSVTSPRWTKACSYADHFPHAILRLVLRMDLRSHVEIVHPAAVTVAREPTAALVAAEGLCTNAAMRRRAADLGWPVYEWCYRETLAPHGWLTEDQVVRKQAELSRTMWAVEYELQEPSAEGRAIDPAAVERMFDADRGTHIPAGDLAHTWRGQPGPPAERPCPDPAGAWYCIGVDWAQKCHYTVAVVVRCDTTPLQVVAGYRIQRRPWPEMTERVGALLDEFPGPAVHDATGAGSAIGEFPALEAHRQLQGVTMVGRDRVDLFRNYIAAIERHEIVCPRIDVFYTEHLYCGDDELFGSGHPPDTVVALALAYHAFKTGRRPGDYGVTI